MMRDGLPLTQEEECDDPGEINDGTNPDESLEPAPNPDTDDPQEALPEADKAAQTDPEMIDELYDQFEMENDTDHNFHRIVDHYFKQGSLIIKAIYSDNNEVEYTVEVPFSIIKKDVPLEVARYINQNVVENRRGGKYNTWSKSVLKTHNRSIRRLHRIYLPIYTVTRRASSNRKNKLRQSRNQRLAKDRFREKFGIKIPNNMKEALILDKENKNNLWAEAILKEMKTLNALRAFKYYSPNKRFKKENGWQFAPLRMIYEVKQQDLRRKARLVIGGHVVDSSMHTVYSSTIQSISVRLLMLVAAKTGLNIMAADIANAYVTAPCWEKIWTVAGPEFGDKQGSVIRINRALYGLATSGRAFHEFLADTLRRIGFEPTRADQDLWYKLSDDGTHYEYVATYVDDIIIAAKEPQKYMSVIEQEFKVRNIEDDPSYYLGNDLKKILGKYVHISSKTYINEVIRKYEKKHGQIKQQTAPMKDKVHPELDESTFLDEKGITHYQQIIGVCQWLIVAGRFDICYAVASLSRFSIAPRKNHLQMAEHILGYLKKFPNRGYLINPQNPKINENGRKMSKLTKDFGNQYHYFKEEMDPRFPPAIGEEMEISIFSDADHGHDRKTGRSITGTLGLVGCTPVVWKSSRQSSVQTSTFGAEFLALKTAVENAILIRYYLRSMGVKVQAPSKIYIDNEGVFLNSCDPGSTLNKKHVALAYHFVREHQANNIVQIYKLDTKDNYADPFTKGLSGKEHGDFFQHLMRH